MLAAEAARIVATDAKAFGTLYISCDENRPSFAQRTMFRFLNQRAGECSDSFNAAI
jgi:hypothetical protein